MGTLSVTPGKVSADQSQGAVIRNHQAAAEITDAPGKAVSLDSNGKVVLADADGSEALSRGVGVIVNTVDQYGGTTVPANGRCSVCWFGPTYGWDSLTPGTFGWVSKTPGNVDDTAPTTAYQYILGQCMAGDVFFVNPGMKQPESV